MLTNESIYIQSYLENITNINKYKEIYHDSNHFTSKTRKILHKIFDEISDIYDEWVHVKNNILNTFYLRKDPFYKNDISFDWIPINIKNHIKKNCIKYYDCTINGKIHDYAIHFSCSNKIDILKIAKYCRMIRTYFIFIEKFIYQKCRQKVVHINICLTDLKKSFKYNNNVSRNDINTAFTSQCGRIYIFRQEEWFKCLIHETIHYFSLSLGRNLHVSDIFAVNKSNINLDETYAETWAQILNCMFISTIYSKKDKQISSFKNLLFNESLFSILQTIKYLNHYQINYKQVTSTKNKITIRGNTFAFSYYVLKMILLNSSIEYLNNVLPNYENFLDISNDLNHILLFERMIFSNYKSDKINKGIDILTKSFRKLNKNHYLFNTSRFSLFEIP